MISQTVDYALRAVVFLGNQPGKSCTTAQLADEIDAPPGYLAKVMIGLSRAEIVRSQRGPNGGCTLARDPSGLTILEVVNAIDAFHRISVCPLGRAAHSGGLCPLHRRMDNVMAAAELAFDQTSLGEILEEPGLLCTLPCVFEPVNLGPLPPE